ncbi:MAG: hypothetical protein GY803_02990 [Chloroflexi bacterium]|nr:hypothetical protein [Chloroflexota bacterium]
MNNCSHRCSSSDQASSCYNSPFMNANVKQLVQAVHDSPARTMLVAAGAGTLALSELLSVAGATRTLLEALVPYSEAAFADFLGQTPPQFVASETARLLAGRAFTRARWLEAETGSNPVVGLACTATIVTDRPKRGEHRAYIAVWQTERLVWHGLHLQKGARDRAGEEELVSRVMLNSFAQAAGVDYQLPLSLLSGDRLSTETRDFSRAASQLHRREIDCFGVADNGRIHTATTSQAILSGAFNPLHDGHIRLAQAAAKLLGRPVAFELSAQNVDKPPLDPETILYRISQFAGRWPILATNAPTFVEKARLLPGSTFIVGHDTAERILRPQYYDNNRKNMLAALTEIRVQKCRFLVAGRIDHRGAFRNLAHLPIPEPFEDLFHPIPDTQFREDISSSQLRKRGLRGSR